MHFTNLPQYKISIEYNGIALGKQNEYTKMNLFIHNLSLQRNSPNSQVDEKP